MCGIAGYFDLALDPDRGTALLRRMCDVIVHRGPDDEGQAVFAGAGIGMRRLSIIDLAGGHQPLASPDGSRQIVFNGEIYNYQAIREPLRARGRRFTTASDTEVILAQLEQEGPAGIQALNGMFGFAIWDERERSLLLARDRLGVKPLYYAWDGRRLLFASEIKAILATGHPRELDPESLWHYLSFRYVPQPRTIWQRIYKLPPGHTLSISAANPVPLIRRYWQCPAQDEPARGGADFVGEFGRLFEDSVRLRLIADVPVGVLLSGGLDSSAVVSTAARLHNGRMKTFSVGYKGEFADDERRYARMVADAVGSDHAEVEMNDADFLDFLPRLAHFTDEPLADLASVPLYYVSRLAAGEVKVVLSGEGSDEVLAGYDLENAARRWQRIALLERAPRFALGALQRALSRASPRSSELLREAATAKFEWFERHPPTMTHLLGSAQKTALLRPELRADFPDSLDLVRADYRAAPAASKLGQVLHAYRQSWLVEDLLMKADRMTMANSIELRVPFLDYRLVEWAARAPDDVKLRNVPGRGWTTKWVLREFCRGRIPDEILTRPKRGFPLPAYERLSTTMKPWAQEMLASDARVHRWLRPEPVRELLDTATQPNASMPLRQRLWTVLILETWARSWQPD